MIVVQRKATYTFGSVDYILAMFEQQSISTNNFQRGLLGPSFPISSLVLVLKLLISSPNKSIRQQAISMNDLMIIQEHQSFVLDTFQKIEVISAMKMSAVKCDIKLFPSSPRQTLKMSDRIKRVTVSNQYGIS